MQEHRGVLLHPQALVHTSRGLIASGNLRRGDTAFSFDEVSREIRPVVVTDVGTRDRAETVMIKVGTRVLCAAAWARVPVLVDRRRPGRLRRRYRREWRALYELERGDIVAVARKTPDLGVVQELPLPTTARDRKSRAVVLPSETSDNLMWWLGLYAGDGYISHKGLDGRKKRIEFAIPSSQPDVRAELSALSREIFGVEAWPRDEWAMVVPGIRLVDFVETIGLSGKALEKRIPSWVYAAPESQRLAFLGGYVDADGDIRTPGARGRNKDMGLTSGNRSLLEDARRLAVMCGIRTSSIWDFQSKDPLGTDRVITGYRMRFAGDFDRITCRSARRLARMRQRKFFHSDTCVGRTTIRSHTSEWLGFAALKRADSLGSALVVEVRLENANNLVAEALIAGL